MWGEKSMCNAPFFLVGNTKSTVSDAGVQSWFSDVSLVVAVALGVRRIVAGAGTVTVFPTSQTITTITDVILEFKLTHIK